MYETSYSNYETAASGPPAIVWILFLVVLVLMLAAMWKLFTKAGKPGWASIVPIYNTVVNLEIVGRPIWWLVLLMIPFVNMVVAIILTFDTAKAFGKGTGFGLLMFFLPVVGYPLLAWGDAKYVGPVAAGAAVPAGTAPPDSNPFAQAGSTTPAGTDQVPAPTSNYPDNNPPTAQPRV